MRYTRFFPVVLLAFLLFMPACHKADQTARQQKFAKLAMQGKEVFEAQECNKCHYVGDAEVASPAPDLTDPLLANDSLFVQAHLKFVEMTDMPPVQLTQEEVKLLSFYIAGLHAAKYPTVRWDKADAFCPVCYAPVLIKQAEEAGLAVKFLGENYYFECQDCVNTFRRSPEAFIELLREYEIDSVQSLSMR